jgi:hypothetical protein
MPIKIRPAGLVGPVGCNTLELHGLSATGAEIEFVREAIRVPD